MFLGNKVEKMKQASLISEDVLMVHQLPPLLVNVVVKWFVDGWAIYFETPAGEMCLCRKSDINKPMEFKSLDSVSKRLNDLGYTGKFLVHRGF